MPHVFSIITLLVSLYGQLTETQYRLDNNWNNYKVKPILIGAHDNEYYTNKVSRKRQMPMLEPADFDRASIIDSEQKNLKTALEWLFQAQAAEKWEEEAIVRTQQVADDARDALEKATDDVRMKSADLQRSREKANDAADSARTAIVSLSAHDQLMNRARQLIYGLTSQIITLQSQLLEAQQRYIFNASKTPLSVEGTANQLIALDTNNYKYTNDLNRLDAANNYNSYGLQNFLVIPDRREHRYLRNSFTRPPDQRQIALSKPAMPNLAGALLQWPPSPVLSLNPKCLSALYQLPVKATRGSDRRLYQTHGCYYNQQFPQRTALKPNLNVIK